jgi:hypothetical protein
MCAVSLSRIRCPRLLIASSSLTQEEARLFVKRKLRYSDKLSNTVFAMNDGMRPNIGIMLRASGELLEASELMSCGNF